MRTAEGRRAPGAPLGRAPRPQPHLPPGLSPATESACRGTGGLSRTVGSTRFAPSAVRRRRPCVAVGRALPSAVRCPRPGVAVGRALPSAVRRPRPGVAVGRASPSTWRRRRPCVALDRAPPSAGRRAPSRICLRASPRPRKNGPSENRRAVTNRMGHLTGRTVRHRKAFRAATTASAACSPCPRAHPRRRPVPRRSGRWWSRRPRARWPAHSCCRRRWCRTPA